MQNIKLLYHYTDFNAMRGIISNGEIWLWNLRRMNDSQEMQYFIKQLKRAVKNQLSEELYSKTDALFDENLKDFNSLSSYASCFSEYSDDAAQWARYGKNGMGVCIAFDKEMLAKIGEESHTPLCQVNYASNVEELEVVKELSDLIKNLKDDSVTENKDIIRELFHRLVNSSPLFKHPSFISEKEYRIVTLPTEKEYLGKPHFFIEETNIKKYFILNLRDVCKKLGFEYVDLFKEICIGPQALVTKDILSDYFESEGVGKLSDKIKYSECPLRRF